MSEGYIIIFLVMIAVMARGVYLLLRLRRFEMHASRARGTVIECSTVEDVSNVIIQYYAAGGVWKICTSGTASEFKVGQEVVVHYMESRPSQGVFINFQAWYDAWACAVGPIFMIILILVWPMNIFGFGDFQ